MKSTGLTEITEELTLTDPNLTIKAYTYDIETGNVSIECIFTETENGFKHSRTFTFANPTKKNIKEADLYSFISGHNKLNKFS